MSRMNAVGGAANLGNHYSYVSHRKQTYRDLVDDRSVRFFVRTVLLKTIVQILILRLSIFYKHLIAQSGFLGDKKNTRAVDNIDPPKLY